MAEGGNSASGSLLGGFLMPTEIPRIPKISDKIKKGSEIPCVFGMVANPSNCFVTFSEGFPGKLDRFVEKMTNFYDKSSKSGGELWENVVAQNKDLTKGSYVAVRHHSARYRTFPEWFRGRILGRELVGRGPGFPRASAYYVRLVDIGETHLKKAEEIAFLHESFIQEPQLAIRSRFALSSFYNVYHMGDLTWPKELNDKLQEVFPGKEARVNFIRKVYQNGEPTWEISVAEMKEPQEIIHGGEPVQEQVIRLALGKYEEGGIKRATFTF